MRQHLATILVGLLASIAAVPEAHAGSDAGVVVFARGSSLWQLPAGTTGAPVEIARLPDGAKVVSDLAAANQGTVLLLTIDGVPHWVAPNLDAPPTAKPLPCAVAAGLSPNGRCAVCADNQEIVVIQLASGKQTRRRFEGRDVAFLGPDGREILASDETGVWALSRRLPEPRRLAPQRPDRDLLAAPNGKRAVGVFRDGQIETLDTFRLDGTAVRRHLLRDATPIAWSADSEYLLVQKDHSACLVRGVGGQYKCWRRYQGVALAPDGSYALVVKEAEKSSDKKSPEDRYDLYWAELAGADTHRPKVRLHNVRAAALWLPPQ